MARKPVTLEPEVQHMVYTALTELLGNHEAYQFCERKLGTFGMGCLMELMDELSPASANTLQIPVDSTT